MPVTLKINYLSLDLHQKEIEIPVDAKDRSKGTVHITVRELPYGAKKEIEFRSLATAQLLAPAYQTMVSLGEGKKASLDQLRNAAEAFDVANQGQQELIRWSLVDHRAEDFLINDEPTPFESVSLVFAEKTYRVASPRMLEFYRQASLFDSFVRAIKDFQKQIVQSPEEIWSAAEEAKKLEAEEAKRLEVEAEAKKLEADAPA